MLRILLKAASVLLACALVAPVAHSRDKLKPGDMAPDLEGTASEDVVRIAEYRGKVVIVSFWATWCAPCRKELPVLAAIQKIGTRDRIAVFAVNWRESVKDLRAMQRAFKEKNYDLTLVSDEYGHAGSRYGVKAIPHMIIIGRDGRIVSIHIGYGEDKLESIADEINAALADPVGGDIRRK